MFIGAHLITGLIIGELTGNYLYAVLGALIVDIDHVYPYIKHKILFSPKKFWEYITNPEDPLGNQRNYLHSLFAWIPISLIFVLINFWIGLAFSIGYLSHLVLDMLDGSDFHLFYPIKSHVKGPIVYLSKYEFIFTGVLLMGYVLLLVLK